MRVSLNVVAYTHGFLWVKEHICFSVKKNSGAGSDMGALTNIDD